MTLLTLEKICKAFRGETVLRDVDLILRKGEKAGLVGRNGCGKTTLLEIIAGIAAPDTGTRRVTGTPSIGLIKQEEDFGGNATLLEAASQGQKRIRTIEREMARISESIENAAKEDLDRLVLRQTDLEEQYRFAGGYTGPARVRSVLSGLGFHESQFPLSPARLSGGEVKRLQIATLLLGGHELLLLDEPGNHLDIRGLEWLTHYLKDYKGALVMVSHDRYLLNALSDRIIEIEEGRLESFTGNYDSYIAGKERAREKVRKELEMRKRLVARDEEFIRRNFYGQKARQAKSRQKRLDRLEPVEKVRADRELKFRFSAGRPSGERVLTMESAAASHGDKIFFKDLDLSLEKGDRLGIIGPNGCGKSTLLHIILGSHDPAAGKISVSPTVKTAYFDQRLKELSENSSVMDELRKERPAITDQELRDHLARFRLTGVSVDKKVGHLSGGEKSRVLLARLVLRKSNLLVLDEPTNHLDLFSREALEKAIMAYEGTVIIVSHDRRLLDRTATHILSLDRERAALHYGNYSSLMEQTETGAAEEKTPAVNKRERKPAKKRRGRSRRKRRFNFSQLEELIISKEERLAEIEDAFYTKEIYTDKKRYGELEEEHHALKDELEELYTEWETWS